MSKILCKLLGLCQVSTVGHLATLLSVSFPFLSVLPYFLHLLYSFLSSFSAFSFSSLSLLTSLPCFCPSLSLLDYFLQPPFPSCPPYEKSRICVTFTKEHLSLCFLIPLSPVIHLKCPSNVIYLPLISFFHNSHF